MYAQKLPQSRTDEAIQHHRYRVSRVGGRVEENSRVVRIVRYDDWHRVERALLHFAREAVTLRENGWIEA